MSSGTIIEAASAGSGTGPSGVPPSLTVSRYRLPRTPSRNSASSSGSHSRRSKSISPSSPTRSAKSSIIGAVASAKTTSKASSQMASTSLRRAGGEHARGCRRPTRCPRRPRRPHPPRPRRLAGVLDLDEAGVDRDPPGLARVRRAVLVVAEAEFGGGRGQLLLDELAAGADPGVGPGPAGEPHRAGEQRGGQRVPRQLRLGVQPHRRQGGAVSGHLGVLLGRTVWALGSRWVSDG